MGAKTYSDTVRAKNFALDHSFIYSSIYSFIDSFMYSFIHSYFSPTFRRVPGSLSGTFLYLQTNDSSENRFEADSNHHSEHRLHKLSGEAAGCTGGTYRCGDIAPG